MSPTETNPPINSSSGLTICSATAEDAPELTRCIKAAYAQYADRGLDLPDVTEGIGEDISAHLVWVATIDHKVIGGLILVPFEDHAHLANIAVDPAYSGRGVGRALIEKAVVACKKRGLSVLKLATHVGLPENVRLYEHLGWREIERSGNKVIMSRDLWGQSGV